MADIAKYQPINGSDLRSLFSLLKTRRTIAFAYGCMFTFVLFTIFLAFNPSSNSSSPWFVNIFSGSSTSSAIAAPTSASYRSQFSSLVFYFFPNSSSSSSDQKARTFTPPPSPPNLTGSSNPSVEPPKPVVQNTASTDKSAVLKQNQTSPGAPDVNKKKPSATTIRAPFTPEVPKQTEPPPPAKEAPLRPPARSGPTNSTTKPERIPIPPAQSGTTNSTMKIDKSVVTVLNSSAAAAPVEKRSNGGDSSVESLMNCNLFDGDWIKDDSYPLYKPGSCSLIDEQFSCISNGRPDKEYLKYKWKPNGCTLPRLDANHMLNMLRGKRLVFVGDSLNRNMWESMVCILRNAAKDKSKVFEAHGRHHFRGEAEYSFVFKDYNFTIEFYVSPFLVQEWEVQDKSGEKKETLRLDLIGKSFDDYKDADIIIFNTGHWWTHEKTSLGKGYYQEGSHVYGELNVLEAFRKALTTWARWVDSNVNPKKTSVFFRGYSASHFSGGQWNSGGACDSETQPIKNHSYLTPYPPKMMVLEKVLRNMKTHVSYLNITQLTDFRKDGHPSIYRKKSLPEAERKAPLRFQDCSHWCLPGVPDVWNELLYAELLIRERQRQQELQKRP